MQRSESIANIAKALAAFQLEVTNPKNTASNPMFKSNYAPLSDVINTIKPIMSKNGLSYIQSTGSHEECAVITTLLMHESGEWIESDPLILPAYQERRDGGRVYNAQGAGSSITYGRRYSLCAILGISSEDDDDSDGQGQGPINPKPAGATPPKNEPSEAEDKFAKEGQVKMLNAKAGAAGYKAADKTKLMSEASAFLGRTIQTFTEVEKGEVTKLATWLDGKKTA